MAELEFKYGAMNSGKSDTLIKTAYNYTEKGLSVATIKPEIDTKGEAFIIARAGGRRPVDILANADMDLRDEIQNFKTERQLGKLACVLIDESQFLEPVQIDQLFMAAKLDDINITAYGLRTDFMGHSFPASQRLWELSDTVEELVTKCECGQNAKHNVRIVNGSFVFSGDQIAIDGEDSVTYDSLCGTCLLRERSKAGVPL